MSQFKETNAGAYPKTARVWSGYPNLSQGFESQTLNTSDIIDQDRQRKNKSLMSYSNRNSDCIHNDQDNFAKTTGKLFNANFSHHDPDCCVCESCTCGRHLCNFKNVKPDMSKASIYNQSYPKKAAIPNKINIAKEYSKLQGPHIAMESRHRKEF